MLDHCFGLLKTTLEVYGVVNKPRCIYNMDESGMLLVHRQFKCITPKDYDKEAILREQGTDYYLIFC